MPFSKMSTDEMRSIVRHQIETLERWLRRLIDDALNESFGGSLAALPIKQEVKSQAANRRNREPSRYPREVDALLFDDLVTILCHAQLYNPYFQDSLKGAFPNGAPEARTFLGRIVEARNPLSHANEITRQQAMRVMCYSSDVIESLKAYYARHNLEQAYNAPSFLRVWDDRGNSGQIDRTEGCEFDFRRTQLRPGDTLQLEVQPDESFADDSYRIEWRVGNVLHGEAGSGRSFSLTLKGHHVTQSGLPIQARILSSRDWHRHGIYDAIFHVYYSVLPPA